MPNDSRTLQAPIVEHLNNFGSATRNENKSSTSRAGFNVGLSYNSIIDDQDDEQFVGTDDLSDFFSKDCFKVNTSQLSNNKPTNFNRSNTSIRKRRRKFLEKSSDSNHCISTEVLPDSFRSRFTFHKFNQMQTEAFTTIYESDESCVISSPTGSGKTVLFELAIFRLIKKYGKSIGNTKVLYVAPIKSLCCEKLKDWGPSFLNLSVGMLTSDTSYSEVENIGRCNIIITTPEKWDLLTRKWKEYSHLFEPVRLVLIDEVHTLREKRGAKLEAVITRMNILCNNVRFIAVSATVPNIEDVAEWLRPKVLNQTTKVLSFDDTYRQVRLQKNVYGYDFGNKNEFQYDSLYNTKLNTVLEKHSKDRPVLIFCPTRASTMSTARYIKQSCLKFLRPQQPWPQPQLEDNNLFDCFKEGVAFHHAGLSIGDRGKVEQGFLDGSVRILCSTSTLAIGVNLSAYLVIVKGTRVWASTMTQEYSPLDVLQMMGRAGHPKFETEGCAVIMTETKMSAMYEKLLQGTESLESSLNLELMEHLTAEICLGTIYSVESAVAWLHRTFFYIRLKKNPSKYRGILKAPKERATLDIQISEFLQELLDTLKKSSIIEQNGDGFTSTVYGYAMSRHYILFDTMVSFLEAEKSLEIAGVLKLLTIAKEFSEIRMRYKEKRLYKEINVSPLLRYPFLTEKGYSEIIDQTYQKISLLIQYELGGLEYSSIIAPYGLHQSMAQDKFLVFSHSFRLLKCLVDIFVEKWDGVSLKNTLFLFRSIYGNCWEDSAMVFRQLNSIEVVSIRKSMSHGVHTIADVRKLTVQQVESYLGLDTGNGAKFKRDIDDLPILHLRCKLESCSCSKNKVECIFELEVAADFKSSTWHGHALSVDIVSFKVSGAMLDFRRIGLAHLKYSRTFRVPVSIVSDTDNLEFTINCLEIAGLGKTISFSAKDLPDKTLGVISIKKKYDALENCLFQPDSDNMADTSISSDDSLMNYLSDESSGIQEEK